MRIRWFGHACFELISSGGTCVLTDPFNEQVGYDVPRVDAQVVTISHEHLDHNYVGMAMGRPLIVREAGETKFSDVTITGVPSFHDANEGRNRGANMMFRIDMDGVRVAHLGDLGHLLESEQVDALGHPDVVLIPVGGTFTIGADEATKVVEMLQPRVVIPMHFETDVLTFPLDTVHKFLQDKKRVRHEQGSTYEIDQAEWPAEPEIVVLNYI